MTDRPAKDQTLKDLETSLGETALYRSTGRFLNAGGLGDVPLNSWGLLVLTPTRLYFRHFPNRHPLFGGADTELIWEGPRDRFGPCEHRVQKIWSKLFSGIPDHLSLTGPGVHLEFELVDFPKNFVTAWNSVPPLTQAPPRP